MGQSVPWKSNGDEKPREGYKMTYIEACETVIEAVPGPIILPQWFLSHYPGFLPGYKFIRDLGNAILEFPVHTLHLLGQERERVVNQGGDAKSNIMSQMLQANQSDGKSAPVLSEGEMLGNLFVFTTAGFDTTANTLSYALVLLCRYPELQDWMFEEIDTILSSDSTEPLDYNAIYPKVVRIMAIMLETLRIFVPVVHLCKGTKTAQVIETSAGTINVPPGCLTYVDVVGLHLDPNVWRDLNKAPSAGTRIDCEAVANGKEDEYLFRPTRWINPPGSPQPLFQPPRGSYMPWSGGPRVCPGQKMAQVEFTAIFLTLFRRHRIEAVHQVIDGRDETVQEKNARLDALMKDSISILTLQMKGVYDAAEGGKDGKGVNVRFSKRK
ncbi:hypothetical protein LTR28_010729 [Elasticomyces elasticus]|nr:hypothetical protein LTR28_010729 [Elasticomyces elasticus]